MICECANTAGSAIGSDPPRLDWDARSRKKGHTDSHDDQESCKEPAKVKYAATGAVDEVIRVGTSPANCVRQWCYDVCCDNEEWVIVREKRR